jgi:hypothetical protein
MLTLESSPLNKPVFKTSVAKLVSGSDATNHYQNPPNAKLVYSRRSQTTVKTYIFHPVKVPH